MKTCRKERSVVLHSFNSTQSDWSELVGLASPLRLAIHSGVLTGSRRAVGISKSQILNEQVCQEAGSTWREESWLLEETVVLRQINTERRKDQELSSVAVVVTVTRLLVKDLVQDRRTQGRQISGWHGCHEKAGEYWEQMRKREHYNFSWAQRCQATRSPAALAQRGLVCDWYGLHDPAFFLGEDLSYRNWDLGETACTG